MFVYELHRSALPQCLSLHRFKAVLRLPIQVDFFPFVTLPPMFLTSTNLIHYLTSHSLLSLEEVVDGDVSVLAAGRRNRNYRVARGERSGLFVKQVKAMDSASLDIFNAEIAVYRKATQHPQWSSLLPRLYFADTQRYVLVLDLVHQSESITQYCWRIGRFSNLVNKLLAQALAQFHHTADLVEFEAHNSAPIRRKPVWILEVEDFPEDASKGAKSMLAYMKKHPIIFKGLKSVRRMWRCDQLIHGDMKWDNCLIYPDEAKQAQIKIIDWELFGYGDRRWDLAGLLHSALLFWIEYQNSQALLTTSPLIEELLRKEREAPAGVNSTMQTLVETYAQVCNLNFQTPDDLIELLQFVAARLVLTTYEGVWKESAMPTSMSLILQLARFIFEDPRRLVEQWFPNLVDAANGRTDHV